MGKVKVQSVNRSERYRIIGELFELIANLRTKKETIDFLIGLLTSSEALMIARRLQIAKLLAKGQSYDMIEKKLRVSHQTIATVEKWMEYDEGKKKLILKKIEEIENISREKENYPKDLLDRYAHHRFFKELF